MACQKDVNNFIPYEHDVLGHLSALIGGDSGQITINPMDDHSIVTQNQSRINIPAHAFIDERGQMVDDPVTISYIELRKVDDFILFNKPTVTGHHTFDSDGIFYLWAQLGNKDIALDKDKKIEILTPIAEPDHSMLLLKQTHAGDGNSWEVPTDRAEIDVAEWEDLENGTYKIRKGYHLELSSLGWFNIARTIDPQSFLHRVSIILPESHTQENSAIFALYNNRKSIARLEGDGVHHNFFSTLIPSNSYVTFVVLAELERNQFSIEVSYTGVISPIELNLSPVNVSVKEIEEILDVL